MSKKLNSRRTKTKRALKKKGRSKPLQPKTFKQTPRWQRTVSYILAVFLILFVVGVCAALLLKPSSSFGAATGAVGILTIICTKGAGYLFKSQSDDHTVLSMLAALLAKIMGAGK